MATKIIDGKALAKKIRAEVKDETAELLSKGIKPGLAVILVGDDRASVTYVNSKHKACAKAGMLSEVYRYETSISQKELVAKVEELNGREDIDGILVQKPLPDHVDEQTVMDMILPEKDVDGFHPVNVGKLMIGSDDALVPATPLGIMRILDEEGIDLKGKNAVIVGRSDIVGKPVAMLLLHRHATVTICHSRTKNLSEVCKQADIVIAAVGRAAMITRDFIKPGAVVIDVGINDVTDKNQVIELFGENQKRLEQLESKGYTLAGDVHPNVEEIASVFTPVPGGVGPLTIAMLLKNCIQAAENRRGK